MSSKFVIFIALFAIGLGVYGLKLGSAPKPEPQQQIVQHVEEEKVKVYVASSSLDKGQLIERKDVSIEYLSKTQANKKGIDKDAVLALGSVLLARKPISQGEIIYPEFTIAPDDEEYVDFVIQPGFIPFPLEVNPSTVIGGIVHSNSVIDILALSSRNQNLATNEEISSRGYTGVSLTPILMGVKVVKVDKAIEKATKANAKDIERTTLILELSPKQVATMTVAKKIAQLEVHKSISGIDKQSLSADAGDVLDDYKSIKEFRANEATIN
jgi:pilus assembly protein CpaB